jgi:hypothetical protein
MSPPSFRELLTRPLVRVALAALGVGMLAVTVWVAGARAVLEGLGASVHALPEVAALEAVMLLCTTLGLRSLYGVEAKRVSGRQWLRAGAMGFAVGAVLPLSRASAEATRAVLLRKSVGGPRAAVAAVQMQGVALLANAFTSLLALSATLVLLGFGAMSMLLLGNSILVSALGASILVVRQHARPGRLLGALAKRGRKFGSDFDAASGASRRSLLQALAWESTARAIQVFQCGVALAAVGRPSGLGRTLVARGMLLVGGALGDVIPAQLGATEATLVVGAAGLGLTAATAATLALLIHGAQLALALVCTGVAVGVPAAPQLATDAVETGP